MKNTDLPRRVKVSEEVLFQEIEGEAVLLDLTNEQYFGLNKVGTRMWLLLSEEGEPTQVLTRLQREFKVDEETLKNDLSVLISELGQQGLISIEN
jgi:hypothetical protein